MATAAEGLSVLGTSGEFAIKASYGAERLLLFSLSFSPVTDSEKLTKAHETAHRSNSDPCRLDRRFRAVRGA